MSSYEHNIFLNALEAEVLLGILADNSADEEGHEVHNFWASIMEQLYRIVNND